MLPAAGVIDDEPKAEVVDSRRLIEILQAGLVIAFLSVWFASSYLGLRPSELMSFRFDDGWCAPASESLFGHCFGDFADLDEFFSGDAWNSRYGASVPYAASGFLIPLGILRIGQLSGHGQAPVLLFVAIAALAMLVPALLVSRRARQPWRTFPLIGVAAAPFLMVMDRGNSIALAVPLIWLIGLGFVRRRYDLLSAALVGAILLKPQLAVFGLLLLIRREYIRAVVVALSSLALTAISFLAFPNHFPANLIGWLRNLVNYGQYQAIDLAYPYNLSAARSILTLIDLTGTGVLLGSDGRAQVVTWLTVHGSALGLALLFLGALVLIGLGEQVPPLVAILMPSLMVMTLSSSTIFGYYTVVLIPVAALIVLRGTDPDARQWAGLGQTARVSGRMRWLVLLTVSLPLVPVVMPASVLGHTAVAAGRLDQLTSLPQLLTGPLLLTSYLVLLVVLAPQCVHTLRNGDTSATGASPGDRLDQGAASRQPVVAGQAVPD